MRVVLDANVFVSSIILSAAGTPARILDAWRDERFNSSFLTPFSMNIPQDEGPWLDSGLSPEEAESLLRPFPAEMMRMYEVSTRVNSPAIQQRGFITAGGFVGCKPLTFSDN